MEEAQIGDLKEDTVGSGVAAVIAVLHHNPWIRHRVGQRFQLLIQVSSWHLEDNRTCLWVEVVGENENEYDHSPHDLMSRVLLAVAPEDVSEDQTPEQVF